MAACDAQVGSGEAELAGEKGNDALIGGVLCWLFPYGNLICCSSYFPDPVILGADLYTDFDMHA